MLPPPPLPRDQALRYIGAHGRAAWKQASGYYRRSLAETAVFRMKTFFSDHLRSRRLDTQVPQLGARCRALNLMTHPGPYILNLGLVTWWLYPLLINFQMNYGVVFFGRPRGPTPHKAP